MSYTSSSCSPARISLLATLGTNTQSHPLQVFIDSGSDDNFINENFVTQTNIPLELLEIPKSVNALDGRLISKVTHRTVPLSLTISGNHSETIQLYVIPSPLSPAVLGLPWLKLHNPLLDWKTSCWSVSCHALRLKSTIPEPRQSASPPAPPDLSYVPSEYRDLALVFNKDLARTLPPHRPYDCAIDLLPGAPLPTSRLFNVSRPEKGAMEAYIHECLASGLIRPSSSPLGAGFFFVEKKDASLRPCIDYRGLNQINVKNKTPLPLIYPSFEPLCHAQIFSKLDLRNAYHLIRICEGDEWKTAFNTPLGQFEYLVMPFGLTNAPAVFQTLMNDLFRDMLNHFVFIYLDDILIFSRSLKEHCQHVRLVLQRLLQNKLYVKPEKCEFHAPSVSLHGYIIAQGKLEPDLSKYEPSPTGPLPKTARSYNVSWASPISTGASSGITVK